MAARASSPAAGAEETVDEAGNQWLTLRGASTGPC